MIFTFGYGNRKDYSQFINAIASNNIKYVVDVRIKPKAWSTLWYSNSIKKCCETLGIHYVSLPSLGNTSGNANWIPPDAIAASIALEKVASMIQDNSVLLLCSELDPAKCHRTEVAKSLAKITKSTIQHLR